MASAHIRDDLAQMYRRMAFNVLAGNRDDHPRSARTPPPPDPIPHTVGPRRAGDPPVLVASNEKAHGVLGWTPRRSTLDEMIGSAWAWRRVNLVGYGN